MDTGEPASYPEVLGDGYQHSQPAGRERVSAITCEIKFACMDNLCYQAGVVEYLQSCTVCVQTLSDIITSERNALDTVNMEILARSNYSGVKL